MKYSDMRSKEVICAEDGERLGFVSDLDFDVDTGYVRGLLVPGSYRFMGVFGREDDVYIQWDQIKKIGDDLIIIEKKK